MSSATEVTIHGAGVIGLSLALELHRRGIHVVLMETRTPASQASWAAAGMLAADDPFNPPALAGLSRLSAALYPEFLGRLEHLSGVSVPFQTERTLQYLSMGPPLQLAERSIDPRQLGLALATALRREGLEITMASASTDATAREDSSFVVHATGAWAQRLPVAPRKGQMLRVKLPAGEWNEVHRSETVYFVPRTQGPQAGTALLGATVEDAGFNTDVISADLAGLRTRAADLLPSCPALRDPLQTPIVEAWAGLRPATPDALPLLGFLERDLLAEVSSSGDLPITGARHLVAAGHYRNGILLAPATAVVIADLIQGLQPPVSLEPFDPQRFAPADAAI